MGPISKVILLAAIGSSIVDGTPLPNALLDRGVASGLNAAAQLNGKYFGTATHLPSNDDTYMQILDDTNEWGQVTPENAMKWDTTESSRGSFNYAGGDAIVAYAQKKNYTLRCHTLVWHSQLPSWVSNGNFNNATLISIMKNHITNLMTRWKGKCQHWDVVNEALNEDGTYRQSVFYNTIGEAFIPIAFAHAASVDPSAKLYYNDYNIEWSGNKVNGALKIVKLIKQYGARIDGVGLQAHFTVGGSPSTSGLQSVMKGYTDLDVDVALTELDIRMDMPSSTSKLQSQATDYANVVKACVNTQRCVGITIWQFTDKYSWVPQTFSSQGAALPWDDNYQKKPAYNAILSALGGTPTDPDEPEEPTDTGTPSGCTVAKWGQCGGSNYSGCTECESGSTCKEYSQYYSQCI